MVPFLPVYKNLHFLQPIQQRNGGVRIQFHMVVKLYDLSCGHCDVVNTPVVLPHGTKVDMPLTQHDIQPGGIDLCRHIDAQRQTVSVLKIKVGADG